MGQPGRLESRNALITGGSRGIGAAIAKAFAAEGCDIAFCHLDDEAGGARVLGDITAAGRRGFVYQCDVGDVAAVRAFFAAAQGALGHIDIVVNNAGICEEVLVEDAMMESLDRMLAVHLRATFLLSQLAYVGMKARGWGRIINVSHSSHTKVHQVSRTTVPPRQAWSVLRGLFPKRRHRMACSSTPSRRVRSIPD